ncbi:glycoside hydrolase family 19 protein [Photorhabdus cinerea]|uniref:glycoside hydrolase family 19 protein n=1 Tax=Photorhabdus cinerea TaxID=471575 RepID=UPI00140AE539
MKPFNSGKPIWHMHPVVFLDGIRSKNIELITLGNYVYANRMGNGSEDSGDGYLYRGRGIIQLTGKHMYAEISRIYLAYNANSSVNLIDNPDLITTDITIGLETAFAFWISKNINVAADSDDIKRVTKLVNGGMDWLIELQD